MTGQFEIINEFSKGLEVELTINQISKNIGKSYAFTNKYVHELVKLDVIKTKIVGSAILCSLNFHNEITIASLVYNSIKQNGQTKNYKEDIVIKYKDKKLTNKKQIKQKLSKIDFSTLKILKGHEIFWRLVADIR